MATNSPVPYPFSKPQRDKIKPTQKDAQYPVWENAYSLPATTANAHDAWKQLEIILVGVIALEKKNGYAARYSKPARLEFFWTTSNARGVVVFDSFGKLIIHAVHAELCYSNTGLDLSERLMTTVGVDEDAFEDICKAVQSRPYSVVVSRQKSVITNGVKTLRPSLEVEPNWTWWKTS